MALEETNEDRLRNEIAQLESDGERMSARIAALEAKLAAEASAVETLGACEKWIGEDVTRRSVVFWGSCEREPAKFGAVLRIGDSAGPHVVNAAYGNSLLAALRAITEAESNSPASEVRE